MSTFVRACVGMELMLEPPSMIPKLYDDRGLPLAGEALFGEVSDGARQRMHRIGDAVIAPAMPAGTADGDIEAAAGQGLRSDVIDIRTIQNQKRLDPASGGGLTAQITHAAEIALALLADVGDEDQIAEVIGEIGKE